jgi:hypothetical protein
VQVGSEVHFSAFFISYRRGGTARSAHARFWAPGCARSSWSALSMELQQTRATS